ncbi:MAG: hypothetical protein JWO00_314 [Candidatus Parcubacteria bacterium]|nr:hypothetical protein [Candidatus Parcubacteria bacterium]
MKNSTFAFLLGVGMICPFLILGASRISAQTSGTTTLGTALATSTLASTTVSALSTSTITVVTVATTTATIPPIAPVRNVHNAADVERQVRAYFADIPIMIDIARCESKFRQFADSGNVFHGGTNSQMIGIFQIYSTIHRATALSLGMDIDTIDGNMRYARYLYTRDRTNPWMDSIQCWNSKPVEEGSVLPPAPGMTLSVSLTFGMSHPEVQTVQRILNTHGFQIAASGPGSLGNETTSFGALTRAAVRQFQCAKNIICGGDEYTTSYGVVGPRTRQALLALASGSAGGSVPVPVPSPALMPAPAPAPQPSQASTTEAARVAAIRAQIEALKAQIANLQNQLPQ